MAWTVSGFYRFSPVTDCATVRQTTFESGTRLGICGTVLIAPEGVNGTIAAPNREIAERFLTTVVASANLDRLIRNDTEADAAPFQRFKVKVKKEIIAFRQEKLSTPGQHVKAEAWNDLLARKDVILLDTRNDYEVQAGTFEGAIDPTISQFGQFARFAEEHLERLRGKPVAMFCTGGIRCEKASAFLIGLGLEEVYQLEGGIVRYLKDVAPEQSRFKGECFVFDERRTLGTPR